jgi:hypothetical protein
MAKKKRDEDQFGLMAGLRRFAFPGILYLIERGLDVSGLTIYTHLPPSGALQVFGEL